MDKLLDQARLVPAAAAARHIARTLDIRRRRPPIICLFDEPVIMADAP